MSGVPLPTGIKGTTSVPKRQEHLVNMYFADGYLRRRAGVQIAATAPTSGCRGGATWYVDQKAYFVIGEVLYSIDGNDVLTSIGTIEGYADVVFSLGQVNLVIVVNGGKGYIYNSSIGLSEITDPDYLPSRSADFIDGRHVFIPSDGSPAFYSEVDQGGTINPLNFFDAEELPDLNKVTINVSNNLYIGGGESFEVYRSTGDVLAPFVRRDGARIDVGYVSGIERYLSSFMFIGRNRDQSYAIHLMSQGSTQIVSNEAISELLNSYTKGELEAVNSFSYNLEGHQFIGWNLPRHTIAFVDGNFIYFTSDLNSLGVKPWQGKATIFAYGRYYVGNSVTGEIGRIVNAPSDFGSDIEYELKSFVRSAKNTNFSINKMEADLITGQDNTTIGLSVSEDARSYSDFWYQSLGEIGEYNHVVQWAGGLGQYESLMGFKLRGTGDIKLSIEGVNVS